MSVDAANGFRSGPGTGFPIIEDAATAEKPVERKGPLFSLSAQDVEIKTVLLALAKEIKQNIIIEPGVSRKVTVDLKDVTLPEALDNLLLPID